MNKLVSLIVGNPLVIVWIALTAFVAGAATAGSAAWWVQGLRITSVEQDFTRYRQALKTQEQARREREAKQREDERETYRREKDELEKRIAEGDAFKRCVAAGKCGRVRVVASGSCSPSLRLPTRSGTDGTGGGAVPVAGSSATDKSEEEPGVVADCARVQLRLNRLQDAVEAQEGY